MKIIGYRLYVALSNGDYELIAESGPRGPKTVRGFRRAYGIPRRRDYHVDAVYASGDVDTVDSEIF